MQAESELAILFADVSGSTQLYEVLGDFKARNAVARCLDIMEQATARQQGQVVKTIGDEIMSVFPTADCAVRAAMQMQEEISGRLIVDNRQMTIRVGAHFGAVITEQGDVYGDAVNLASRVTNQAKAGQILTTGETVARLSAELGDSCRQIDRAAVRGKREPVDLYEVIWQLEDVTRMRVRPWATAPRAAGGRLILIVGDRRTELGGSMPTLTIGRAEQNDLVVGGEMVSRLHARAEYRNGRFVFTDQSANGTFVVTDAGDSVFLHREDLVLTGAGMLGLGTPPEPGSPATVRYETVGAD